MKSVDLTKQAQLEHLEYRYDWDTATYQALLEGEYQAIRLYEDGSAFAIPDPADPRAKLHDAEVQLQPWEVHDEELGQGWQEITEAAELRYFQIENTISGFVLGVYPGHDEDEALENYARDVGHASYHALESEFPSEDGEILITEV